jgi:uncharacterized protein YjbI with pentapeptide repeats
MANEEHVALLTSNVDVWNTWRRDNSSVLVDLSAAKLSRVNLNGANLRGRTCMRKRTFTWALVLSPPGPRACRVITACSHREC